MQALNIPTKINKGTIEITSTINLIKEGDKVGSSEATLLAKLGVRPFEYGLRVHQVSSPFSSAGLPLYLLRHPCWKACLHGARWREWRHVRFCGSASAPSF